MTACKLVADADLAHLCDEDFDLSVDASLELARHDSIWELLEEAGLVDFGLFVADEDADFGDLAGGAAVHADGRIADILCFFAEDGAKKTLFGAELLLAFRSNLADENVAWINLGTDSYDTIFAEVAERALADVRDVAGDLLGTELRLADFDVEIFDIDGGELVVLY